MMQKYFVKITDIKYASVELTDSEYAYFSKLCPETLYEEIYDGLTWGEGSEDKKAEFSPQEDEAKS